MKKWILTIVLATMLGLTGCANHISTGIDFLEEGDYDKAQIEFQSEIEKGKHLDEAYRGFAIACFEKKEYEEAARAFELAVKNDTEETATLFGIMGACYMELEEHDKALDAYTKALSSEDITEELKQEVQYNLIIVYENMADWEAAKEQMKVYQKAYPNDERVEKEAAFLETR